MTTPPERGRKVRQLDNDMQSIYDLLAGLDVGVKQVHAGQLRQGGRLVQQRGQRPAGSARAVSSSAVATVR